MDTATLIGRKCNLATEFRGFTPDVVWEVKNATSVGGKVILAVNNGSKGLAAPIEMFVLQDAEPVAPAPKPRATRFKMDGAEKDSPLYEVFQKCAPDDELSKELYVLYQSEYSEFDIEFIGTLAGQVNATVDSKWSKEQVGEMLQLLNATYDETAWRVPMPAGAEVVEGPVVETAEVVEVAEPEPEEMPAIRPADVTSDELMAGLDNLPEPVIDFDKVNKVLAEASVPPKRRGRPVGSKNKPRLPDPMNLLKDSPDGALMSVPSMDTKALAKKVQGTDVPLHLVALALKVATVLVEAAKESGDEYESVLEHAFSVVENLI